MNTQVNVRAVILDILLEIYEKEQYTHLVLNEALSKYQYLQGMERSFISRTVLGTVERTITLDYIIDSFSKTKVNKMKPLIRTLLRMSTYQLVYMEGVKDFAVCNDGNIELIEGNSKPDLDVVQQGYECGMKKLLRDLLKK